MIALSPGVAQGCFDLLDIVSRTSLSLEQIVASFSHFSSIKSSQIAEFAQGTRWIKSGEDNVVLLTPEGARLLALAGYQAMLRQALIDYIDVSRPPWIQCAISGRRRVMAFVGSGIAQVMVEAGLTSGYGEDVVSFWDELAARARGLRDSSMSRIGRLGERLTIEHEAARTGITPRWIAVNSNEDGYDVLSIVGNGDPRLLSIEVKTSSQGLAGFIYLTRNEWEMSQERAHHLFHLWDVKSDPPRLAKVSIEAIATHLPSDSGLGRWDIVSIPFTAFGSIFNAANYASHFSALRRVSSQ